MSLRKFFRYVISALVFLTYTYETLAENATDYETGGYVPQNFDPGTGSFSYTDAKDLLDGVMGNYDLRLRPRLSQTDPVIVQSAFVPMAIVEFDTSGQSMLVSGYFTVTWVDELISWDNTFFGTNTIRMSLKNIWYPRLVLSKTLGRSVIGNNLVDVVTVSYTGDVTWVPDGQYRFICDVDVTYYPFDRQKCSMTYYVTDQTVDSVELNVTTVSTSDYNQNAEWSLQEVTSDVVSQHSTNLARVTFTIQRRTEFTVYTLVLPILTLTIINVFSFLVPIQTGEKGGLSITIFLTYAFFITLVRDALPHNSLQTSRYAIFLCSSLILSVLHVVYTVIESKLYFTRGKDRAVFAEMLIKRYEKHAHPNENIKVQVEPKATKQTMYVQNESGDQQQQKQTQHHHHQRNKQQHESKYTITWTHVLTQADKIAFTISLVYKVIFSIVIYYQIGMNFGDPE